MSERAKRPLAVAAIGVLLTAGALALGSASAVAAGPPTIAGESFSNVGSSEATVSAQINPGGLPTTYSVQYGTSTEYGSSTTEVSAGAGETVAGVQILLTGLQPATTYHARVVAQNELGAKQGNDLAFTTEPLSGASTVLPDNRVYELVSVGSPGELYVPQSETELETFIGAGWPERASTDGNALTYVAVPSPTGGNGANGQGEGDQYLTRRSPAGEWTAASNITPPGSGTGGGYVAFSNDLSAGVVEGYEQNPPLVAGGPEAGLYVRANADGGYRLLPATEFSPNGGFLGATADFGHLVLAAEGGNLLDDDWGTGQSSVVNILPGGATNPNPVFDSISANGSLIGWSGSDGNLYARENVGTPQERTVQIDASQGPGGGGGASFGAASADGSKVFFTDGDSAGLTGDTVPGSGANLYEFDVASGHLSDLSATSEAGVQSVIGSSDDGGYVYFIATGDLAAGATAGQPNIYLRRGGVTTFVATNASGVQVAPDGRHLLLQSSASQALHVYDAEAGRVACVSCNHNGEPVAARLGNDRFGSGFYEFARYVPHWMSDDGSRVFFEAGSLVPQDTVGLSEFEGASIYEWERGGTGSCQSVGGCTYLLSGGSTGAFFVDASANGNDVFFITRSQLVAQDRNDYTDVYDARVDGYRALSPPLCTGTGCQGVPPPPPIFATPSSVTFSGVGNFGPPSTTVVKPKSKPPKCQRGRVKRHGRCVKRRAKTPSKNSRKRRK